jgi:hypothetical protein
MAVLIVIAVVVMRRRRRTTGDVLKEIGVKSMHDVVLPDSMGGAIHLQHVLLTAKGILVVEVKSFEGKVFASDRMDEWTVISENQRYTFPNPQPALFDRVAAIKAVARDIPVSGFVLFPAAAEFGKDRPSETIYPDELRERYGRPHEAELERLVEAFYPHWEKVQRASEPAPRATSRV